jgi:hypothetical protein
MKLVAFVKSPANADEAAKALAASAGMVPAEARMRLAPEPPALLARLGPEKAGELVGALRKAGLAALAVDDPCPGDRHRLIVRSLSLEDAWLGLTPREGDGALIPWPDVLAVLRGVRMSRADVERTEKTKRFSPVLAAATGGLMMSRSSTTSVRSSQESTEQVILVYVRGGRAALLAEGELDFQCLGAGLQPSSTANMAEVARRLREKAKGAFHDDRLLRLGRRPLPFLAGGESRAQAGTTVTTRTDTSGSLDTLAEVLRQGLLEGLLP